MNSCIFITVELPLICVQCQMIFSSNLVLFLTNWNEYNGMAILQKLNASHRSEVQNEKDEEIAIYENNRQLSIDK